MRGLVDGQVPQADAEQTAILIIDYDDCRGRGAWPDREDWVWVIRDANVTRYVGRCRATPGKGAYPFPAKSARLDAPKLSISVDANPDRHMVRISTWFV